MTIYLDSHPIAILYSPFGPRPHYASFRLTKTSLSVCHTAPSGCRCCPFKYDCTAGTLKPRILAHLHTNYPELFL